MTTKENILLNFTWGPIQEIHEIRLLAIVEYIPNRPDNAPKDWEPTIKYHLYVNGKDTSRSYSTLEHALLNGIWKTSPEVVRQNIRIE